MTKQELTNYLSVGAKKSVCIDRRVMPEYSEIVRTIEICESFVIRVSFDAWGYDEGGAYFRGKFESLDDCVKSIEKFIQTPLKDWENFTKTGFYPIRPEPNELGQKRFSEDLEKRSFELPEGIIDQ